MYCFDIETAGKLLHNPWYSISEIVEPSALRRLKLLYVKVLQGYQNFLRTYATGSLGYLYKNKQKPVSQKNSDQNDKNKCMGKKLIKYIS